MGKARGTDRKFFNGYGQGIARPRHATPHLLAAKAAVFAPGAAVEHVFVDKTVFHGKRAVIIGAGVGGLTTAYELLHRELGLEVIVLEARDRTGGRCLTLRTGDTLVQDATDELFPENPEEQVQVVRFDRPLGDSEPYLNAGPGRIPSNHTLLLNYLQRFGVDLEVYVMNSASNLAQIENKFDSKPLVYRRLEYNTKGYLSELIWKNAKNLIKSECVPGGLIGDVTTPEQKDLIKNLKSLARTFGALDENGRYIAAPNEEGTDDGVSDRAGYIDLPGVGAGTVVPPVPFKAILDSSFWQVNFFQHYSFLWQPTLFQPVGGMDRVQHAFAQQVAALGGTIHLNSPVSSIDWDVQKNKFKITAQRVGKSAPDVYEADYVFSNAAIPFLKKLVSDELFGKFSASFQEALLVVYDAQFGKNRLKGDKTGTKEREPWKRFLACTNKVGWQAERSLWQTPRKHSLQSDGPINDEDLAVIPIFGGISRTTHTITQIWYPSTGFHDKKGILTGCYNYEQNAYNFSLLSVADRINLAREGARLFGNEFADGLRCGVTIAWHHMPFIKGGWTQWQFVGTDKISNVTAFNHLIEGTQIAGSESKFFIVGDQLSSQPGWQEGAVASAVNAVDRLLNPTSQVGYLASLPDTRISVQGI